MTGKEIRAKFLDYFQRNGHTIVASSGLIPHNDPTLLFTNAGMNQFKDCFLGMEKRDYVRACSSQKCVRAGGKHNDLENVGRTARHHTFFEMLGNFSFGDYFKKEAIAFAWEFLTKEMKLDKDRLYVTVYTDDDEAADIWHLQEGVPRERIYRFGEKDNFWSMGDTGPCGPCTEIFWDNGPEVGCGSPTCAVGCDCDRYMEIWNNVFMQFNRSADGTLTPLPKPSVDTGMGLERICTVMQGVKSNYDTDLLRGIIDYVARLSGKGYRQGDDKADVSMRVIADHSRAVTFLICDGVLPSNEGRGYVLRRIMRRAMRHAQLLGAKDPVMWKLVPALVREMGQAYPELVRSEPLIVETLRTEETRFRTTLARGLGILEEETRNLQPGQRLSGETAFKLYDTFGFPLDLTQDALRVRNLGVDTDGFDAAMERQRAEARKAWAGSGESATEAVWFGLREKLGATEFLGYAAERAEGVVTAVIVDGAETSALAEGTRASLIVNQTPFYGESGGQVGDSGLILGPGGRFRVDSTSKKLGDLIVHDGVLEQGILKVGDALELAVDHARRSAVRANHSATHLLHEALRQVLGDHVAQKGSLVAPDRLRFDFSHPRPISDEDLERIEEIANRVVLENAPVATRLMAVDDAIESGARALFGEKYGEEVRVVSMGVEAHGGRPHPFSIELCGGTHVERTGDIGLVSIVAESAVGSGVRRIEAKTGAGARHHLNADARRLREIALLVRAPAEEAASRLTTLIEDRKRLERELGDARRKLAMGASAPGAPGDAAPFRDVAGVKFFSRAVAGVDMKDLKSLADEAKKTIGSGVVAIANTSADGKGGVVVSVTSDLAGRFNAVDFVRVASEALGGKGGGGRPDMAQAGGPDGSQIEAALSAVEAALRQKATE